MPDESLVALLPGRRPEEISRILPFMLQTAAILGAGRRLRRFVLGLAPSADRRQAQAMVQAERATGAPGVAIVEGRTHEEIAALLDLAAGTSKAQLFRARRLLREALRKLPCVPRCGR